jgi:hypothetical protein
VNRSRFGVYSSMPWIRMWHQGKCPSGIKDEESVYVWFDERPSDDCLKDEADERVPDWRKQSERGYKYGFEDVPELPEKVRLALIKRYERLKVEADRMLGILVPTEGKSRLDRI